MGFLAAVPFLSAGFAKSKPAMRGSCALVKATEEMGVVATCVPLDLKNAMLSVQ
jgi:hypothetical protein